MGFNNSQNRIFMISTSTSGEFRSKEFFDLVEKGLKFDGPNLVKKVKGVFCFQVTNGPGGKQGSWIIDAKNGSGKVVKDGKDKADVTIIITDNDLMDLMNGSLNPQKAFFQGKLKIRGNMGLAMKLQEFQKQAEELRAKL